jgi:hypothetical protein
MTSTVNTRAVADRRTLAFRTAQDLSDEVERIIAAAEQSRARTTGNWSVGQIFDHLAAWMEGSLDGFDFSMPWPVRIGGRLLKRRMLTRPFPTGVRPPGGAAKLLPDAEVPLDQGAARIRAVLARIHRGEPMPHPSPLLGPLTQDEWIQLHLRHAESHLGFVHPDAG